MSNQPAAANPLLTAPIAPTLLRLSLPNMIAMLATTVVAMAETAYAGILGTPALAGLALVFPMLMLQQMMSAGAMGGGVSSAISRALGAGNAARAQTLAMHAVVIGLVMGIAVTALFLVAGPAIYRALGGRGAALDEALRYSNIAFLGVTGMWLTNTLSSVLRGTGNMKVPSTILFLSAAAQIVLSGVLGLGFGPIPRLGMTGIALGQTLAAAGAALFLLAYLMSGRGRLRLGFDASRLERPMFADILKVGAIACASPIQSVATVLVITALVATRGIETIAGYGIGARLEFLLVPLTFAIGVASVPMVGMAIGAGNVARARKVAWTAATISAAMTGTIGVIVAIWPDLWARLFTSDAAVLEAARQYFRWAGPSYVFYGFGLCLYFASQGSGKVLGVVAAATVRLGVVAIGGWLAVRHGAPFWMFAVVLGCAHLGYGLATALAVTLTRWGR